MARLSVWLQRKQDDVIRRWKNDELTMIEAVQELVALGIPALKAWEIIQKA